MNLAIIGLGVMGRNLALNFRDAGHTPIVWDPWPQAMAWRAEGVTVSSDLDKLVASLKSPRVILLMIKAGEPVRKLVHKLRDMLEPGDIVIDGGNAHFQDTIDNASFLQTRNINFAGLGVSGGAEGARNGPSMMLGCSPQVRDVIEPLLSSVAAKFDGKPCLGWFGDGGAGHFVKMVHNGIEYAIMQAISESWQLLELTGMSTSEAGQQLGDWAQGALSGYLMEISAEVLQSVDSASGQNLVSIVDHAAGQKGTGRWCVEAALELGVPVPSIMGAVTMRQISSYPRMGARADTTRSTPKSLTHEDIYSGLSASIALALAQGAHLLEAANDEYDWRIETREAARVWQAGSILRMGMLDNFSHRSALFGIAKLHGDGLRKCVGEATLCQIPAPVMGAGLFYYDGFYAERLPTALVQLQRDRFGAHGLKHTLTGESFHGPWHEDRE